MINLGNFGQTQAYGYIVLVVIALMFLITLFIFAKQGIIKYLFIAGYLVGLVFAFIKLKPMLFGLLDGLGFMPEMIGGYVSGKALINIIVIAAIILVWIALVAILNKIFSRLFKYEKGICGFFGFLIGIPVAFALTFVANQLLTSPYLLDGVAKGIHDNKILTILDEKAYDPIENALEKVKIPSSIEAGVISKTAKLGTEEYKEYKESFNNIYTLREDVEAYYNTNINDELVTSSIHDINNVLVCLENYKSENMKVSFIKDFEELVKLMDGNTYTVGEEKQNLLDNLENYEVSEETMSIINTVLQ